MTEPKRLLDELGPDDPLAKLLQASATEQPPPGAEDRAILAMRTVDAGSAGTVARPWLGPAIGAGVIVAGAVAWYLMRQPSPVTQPSPPVASITVAPTVTTPSPSAVVSSDPPPEKAPVVAPVVTAPVSAKPAIKPKPEASSQGSLVDEIALIDQARGELAAHDATHALGTLDRHDREFPRGAFGPEATVLRVQALLDRGDRPAADKLGRAFIAANPDSPQATRIRSLLGLQ